MLLAVLEGKSDEFQEFLKSLDVHKRQKQKQKKAKNIFNNHLTIVRLTVR